MAPFNRMSWMLCTLFGLFTMAQQAMAFKVPAKLPDGMYEVSFNGGSRGKQFIITQYDLDSFMHINVTSKHNDDRHTFPISLMQCPKPGSGWLDWAHSEIARDLLGTWCELYNPKIGGIVMAVYGNSSWYLCDYNNPPVQGDTERTCSRREVDLTSRRIDDWCGERKNGYVQAEGWGMAYGRSLREVEICPRLEVHDRRYDRTLPWLQHHRMQNKGGGGVFRGDRVTYGKDAAGIWGLKKLGEGSTDWRGPKGGELGTSGGKGRKNVGHPPKDPEEHKTPGWDDGINLGVPRLKHKPPQKIGRPPPP